MNLFIRDVCIVTSELEQVHPPTNIAVKDGMITTIGILPNEVPDHEFHANGAYLTPGWCDLFPQMGEPGEEFREDLQSLRAAAASGGYTAIVPYPNTKPVIQSKAEVQMLTRGNRNSCTQIHPIGSLTVNGEGKDMAELTDMHHAGAVGFSDGPGGIQDAGLLTRVLDYSKSFDGLIIDQPNDRSMNHGAQIHEGLVSTQLGMKGSPSLSEELMVHRDLVLQKYTNGRMHLSMISSKGSLNILNDSNKDNNITASAAVMNLCFTDASLWGFDTMYKVQPPLRGEEDKIALWEALDNDIITAIVSNHVPWDRDHKDIEFPYAKRGVSMLQYAYACLNTFGLKPLLPHKVFKWFAQGPRKIAGIPLPEVKVGQFADFTIFDPIIKWTPSEENQTSKSDNHPFLKKELSGRVLGVVRGSQAIWNKIDE